MREDITSLFFCVSLDLSSNLSGKSLKIVHFETGGSGNYKTANIIFDVSNFSTLHFDGTGGIGSGGFAVLGGSGVNIPYGTSTALNK